MKHIKIKTPAKVNLTLEILNKRSDGYHNLQSVMQTVSLYDYLDFKLEEAEGLQIKLSGNSDEIPYDEKNIIYKAVSTFLDISSIKANVNVYIDKNIPVSAGLAGGSTDGTGVILALNEIFGKPFDNLQLHKICSTLGSDLNFCLEGGCKKATSRGEILEDMEFIERNVSLIKPLKLGINTKEAYKKFSQKPKTLDRSNFVNDLEWAIIEDYSELKMIKQLYPQAVMTGSGSTFFAFDTQFKQDENFWVKNNIKTIPTGCTII